MGTYLKMYFKYRELSKANLTEYKNSHDLLLWSSSRKKGGHDLCFYCRWSSETYLEDVLWMEKGAAIADLEGSWRSEEPNTRHV
jgi:hypothetical protein